MSGKIDPLDPLEAACLFNTIDLSCYTELKEFPMIGSKSLAKRFLSGLLSLALVVSNFAWRPM